MHNATSSSSTSQVLTVWAYWWLWLRFCLRRIIKNPLRISIVVVSVALSTTLATAVFRVSAASVASFEQSIAGGNQRYHALISPAGGRFHINAIAPCLQTLGSLADVLVVRREAATLSFREASQQVRLVGIGMFGASGAMASDQQRLIRRDIADALGLAESEVINVQIGAFTQELSVVRASSHETLVDADLVVALSEIPGSVQVVDSIALRFHNESSVAHMAEIRQWLVSCMPQAPPVRIESVQAPIQRGVQLLAAYRFNVMIMAIITILVCAILIAQATQIALRGVSRELSILRTLGVSERGCFTLIVSEVGWVCLLGALLGVTAGAPLVVFISGFLTATATEIYGVSLATSNGLGAVWSTGAILLGVSSIGTLAASVGAREVLAMTPYRGARYEQRLVRPLSARHCLVLCLASGLLACCGIICLIVYASSLWAYITIGLILLWIAGSVPIALYCTPFILGYFRQWLAVRFARATLKASGRNFVLSSVAASVAIALLVGLSLMVSSFRQTLASWSVQRLAGDIFISSAVSGQGNEERISGDIVERVRENAGIKRIIPYYETSALSGDTAIIVGGVDLATQCVRGIYTFRAGRCLTDAQSWSGGALISEGASRKLGLRVGDTVLVNTAQYTVQGVVQEFGTEQPLVIITASDFTSRYAGHNPDSLTLDLVAGADVAAVSKSLRDVLPSVVVIRDQRQLLSLVETLFDRTFRITDSVRWIVFALALLGLVATIAQDLWERRKEIRVAEAMGTPVRTLVGMLCLEAVSITASAVVIGLLGGIAIGWCLTEYINPLVFGWSLVFCVSWGPCIEALGFIALVGIASACMTTVLIRHVMLTTSLQDE